MAIEVSCRERPGEATANDDDSLSTIQSSGDRGYPECVLIGLSLEPIVESLEEIRLDELANLCVGGA